MPCSRKAPPWRISCCAVQWSMDWHGSMQPWAVETLQHMQVEDDQWAVRNLANQYLEQMHISIRAFRAGSPSLLNLPG